jgi:hypothetical protein
MAAASEAAMAKASKAERSLLERMFVHHFKERRVVSGALTTNATQNRHHDLCQLQRKGLITFDDNRCMQALFGPRFWDVKLTDAGRHLLEDTFVRLHSQPLAPDPSAQTFPVSTNDAPIEPP